MYVELGRGMNGLCMSAMEFGLGLGYPDGRAALVVLKMSGVRNWYGKESEYQGDIRRARLHCSDVTVEPAIECPLIPASPSPGQSIAGTTGASDCLMAF